MTRRRRLGVTLAGLLLGLACGTASAQESRPLTLVVPSGPGSAPDIVARVVGDELRARLGQPVVVENRPGAGGIIAAMSVKGAKPDGHTLLFTQAAVVTVTPLTYRAVVYDAERDFEAVSVVADTPMLFVAHPSSGMKSLADLLGAAKAKPGAVPLGSPARGSVPHLSAELLAQAAQVRFNTIPMTGSAQAIQALMAGDTQVSVDGIAALLPLVRGGRVTPLAVTADRVLPGMENLPLARDTVPGLVLSGWFMVFAPKGTPAARVQALNAAIDQSLKVPEVVKRLATTANYPIGGSVADARAFIVREKRLWAGAAERAGLQRE